MISERLSQPRPFLPLIEKPDRFRPASLFFPLPEADMFSSDLKREIDNATQSIRIQEFLYSKMPGIQDALDRAAKRGVRVRYIIGGLPPIAGRLRHWGVIHHIQSLRKNHYDVDVQYAPRERGESYRPWQRDHTKNIVIDAELPEKAVAYIGGRNVWKKDPTNRDFMLKIKGELVQFAKQDFDATWNGSENRTQSNTDHDGNTLLSDTRNSDQIPKEAVVRIRGAKRRVWMTTPYLDRPFISPDLLAKKADNPALDMRFVSPRPRSNNHFYYKIVSFFYLRELAQGKIPVFGFKKGDGFFRGQSNLDHSKILITDNEVMLGSSNYSRLALWGGQNAEIELISKNSY